jgi:hypothetical protein
MDTLHDPLLKMASDMLDDLEAVRLANENRLRQLTRSETDVDGEERGFGFTDSHPAVKAARSLVDGALALEHQAELQLQRQLRAHPLGPWMKPQRGIGPKQGPRLLAAIGDPYMRPEMIRADGTIEPERPRTVSELWAYCVPAGELVSTPNGARPIEGIQAGDFVYGHAGKPVEVTASLTRDIDEDLIVVHARKLLPLRLTGEHPVLVARFGRHGRANAWRRESLDWVRAEDIRPGDYVVVPRLPEGSSSPTEPDADTARFWGRFVGDGSTSIGTEGRHDRGRATITFGHHEVTEPWERIARQYGGVYVGRTGTAQQMQFGRLSVAQMFRSMFGHDARNKRASIEVMESGAETTRAFLDGYVSADGHVTPTGRTASSTVSRGLAVDLQLLSTRLGSLPSTWLAREAGSAELCGRTIQQADRYNIAWSAMDSRTLTGEGVGDTPKLHYRQDEHYFYAQVTAVGRERYTGPVYDLSCGGSFLLNNVIVHNCGMHVIDIDLPADQQHGDTQGGDVGGEPNGGDPGHVARDTHASTAGVAAHRRRGQRSNWNADARMRVYLVAAKCVMQPDGTRWRDTYTAARAKYAGAVHRAPCVRCGPSGKPAAVGSPLSAGHQHARAVRIVAKTILKELWREAGRLHGHDTSPPPPTNTSATSMSAPSAAGTPDLPDATMVRATPTLITSRPAPTSPPPTIAEPPTKSTASAAGTPDLPDATIAAATSMLRPSRPAPTAPPPITPGSTPIGAASATGTPNVIPTAQRRVDAHRVHGGRDHPSEGMIPV